LDSQPDFVSRAGVPGGGAVFYGGCYLHKPWDCVIEELFVAIAEVILTTGVSI
jgi:hypothetical protein